MEMGGMPWVMLSFLRGMRLKGDEDTEGDFP